MRRFAMVTITAILAALAVACMPIAVPTTPEEICGRYAIETGWQPDLSPTADRDVVVVGDSLSFGLATEHALEPVLDAETGDHLAMVDGRIGCTTGERAGAVEWYAEHHPDVLVIELGTNDVRDASIYRKRSSFASAPLALVEARNTLRDLTSYAKHEGVGCVVFVGVNQQATGDFDLRRFGPAINDTLSATARSDSSVRFADWERASRSHPEWFVDDHVHLTGAGSDGMASLIADTVHTCPDRG